MRIHLFGKGAPRAADDSLKGPATNGRSARDAGDRARDLGDWSEAARCYVEYLASEPKDFAIWVQLGNSRKDLGDYEDALRAYDTAITLDDREPDVRLQKGHALKLAGRIPEAIASYRLSVELSRERNPALQELAALAPEELAVETAKPTLHGWAMREMAPWRLKGINPVETEAIFVHLNAATNWAALYRFHNGEVSLEPKPEASRSGMAYGHRAIFYLEFFRAVAETLPKNFSVTLCMTLDDVVADGFGAPIFCFQKKRRHRNPLLPDIEFLTNDFYRDSSFIDTIPNDKKIARAVFSGSTTGGHITPGVARTLSLPRLRAAGYFQGNERVDFRLPNIVHATPEAQALLEKMPFCRKPRLDWKEQLQRRFILSIDGNGATCSRVVITLLSNSLLLKYNSDNIMYYFEGMQQWVHYVPISDDSDVESVIACNPALFKRIAAAGRKFAATYLNHAAVLEYTRMLLTLYGEIFSDIRDVAVDQGSRPVHASLSLPDRIGGRRAFGTRSSRRLLRHETQGHAGIRIAAVRRR
jgi:tetratricopeptide (TPR) repeat protein